MTRRARVVRLKSDDGVQLIACLGRANRGVNGPLCDTFVSEIGFFAGTLRFRDRSTYALRRRHNVFLAVGVFGGAVLMPQGVGSTGQEPAVARVRFCESYAKKLGLEPGQARFFTVHPY